MLISIPRAVGETEYKYLQETPVIRVNITRFRLQSHTSNKPNPMESTDPLIKGVIFRKPSKTLQFHEKKEDCISKALSQEVTGHKINNPINF